MANIERIGDQASAPALTVANLTSPLSAAEHRRDSVRSGIDPQIPLTPSLDIPFTEQLDQLISLAEQGHSEATCRVLTDSYYCSGFKAGNRFAASLEKSTVRGRFSNSENLAIDAIARAEGASDKRAAYCAGFDANAVPDLNQLLRNSIGRLSTKQKVAIAMTRPDGSLARIPLNQIPTDSIAKDTSFVMPQVVADNVVEFLTAGIRAREPLALEGVLLLHVPGFVPSINYEPRVWLPNVRKFTYYSAIYASLYGERALGALQETAMSARSTIPTDELTVILDQAEAEASRWRIVDWESKAQRQMELRPAELCSE